MCLHAGKAALRWNKKRTTLVKISLTLSFERQVAAILKGVANKPLLWLYRFQLPLPFLPL